MEPDFITRHHIDSLTPCNDPGTFELLNRYKNPPVDPRPPRPPQQFMGTYPIAVQGNSEAVMLGHMIGQLQGTLQNQQPKSNFDGFSMNVNTDILRWVILFLFLALLVWVILTLQKDKSGESDRIAKLEKQLKKLRRYRKKRRKRKKNPKPLQEEELLALELDEADEDEVEEFDLLDD